MTASKRYFLDHIKKILELNIGISQRDNRQMFAILDSIFSLKLSSFKSGREHNGWVVPDDWLVHQATIHHQGELVFDGKINHLAVIGYSESFVGTISKQELDKHIYYKQELPDAYSFHCINNYRPWAREWGFCVPYNIWKSWPDGDYQINLQTQYRQGEMLVGECNIQGSSKETIVFNAHTCHPCQFNDGFAGIVVILELFNWLRTQPTHYSYRAVFAPEHLGTVFYLASMPEQQRQYLKLGIFTEMIGIDENFALQQSFTGNSIIDRVAKYVLTEIDPATKVGKFRTIVGNDETVWEAPGIEIPFISISRCVKRSYYPQYHTSQDNLEVNSIEKLDEALAALKAMVTILEQDRTIERRFTGLIALSNPKYHLYIERPDPTIAKNLSERDLRMGQLQDYLPRYFDGKHTIFEIAEKFEVPFQQLRAYLDKFAEKSLVSLHPLDSLDQYAKSP